MSAGYSIKNVIRPIYEHVWKAWEKVFQQPNGTYPLVIQGIQRSGTNYVTAVLSQSDYRIINKIDPARNCPSHKHFRWQEDKTTIVMDARYKNTLIAKSIKEINKICDYPDNYRHVVIFRAPDKWLNSIYRWGLGCGWYKNEKEFFAKNLHNLFLNEWDAYYSFWQNISQISPDAVLFIEHGEFASDPVSGLKKIDQFMDVHRTEYSNEIRTIKKVRHSRPLTEARETCDQNYIAKILEQKLEFDWHAATEAST